MKQKHKAEIELLRADLNSARSDICRVRSDLADLVRRHEAFLRTFAMLKQDHEHLCEALSQRGIWSKGVCELLKERQ